MYVPKLVRMLLGLPLKQGAAGRFLAGGTDLFVLIHDRKLKPKTVIDLKPIEGINGIEAGMGKASP